MEIGKFQGVQNPKTHEPINKKFGVGDYVGDDSQHAKTQNDRSIGGVVFSFPILFCDPQILLAFQD